jgi:hypothetical protein
VEGQTAEAQTAEAQTAEAQPARSLAPQVQTAVADVYVEDDGTLVLRFHNQARAVGDQGAEVVHTHVAVAAGRKLRTLADVRGIAAVDHSTRQLAAGPTLAAVTLRMAVLVGDPLSRTLGNFFLRVARPAYPTRLFSDEAAARRWLHEETSK